MLCNSGIFSLGSIMGHIPGIFSLGSAHHNCLPICVGGWGDWSKGGKKGPKKLKYVSLFKFGFTFLS